MSMTKKNINKAIFEAKRFNKVLNSEREKEDARTADSNRGQLPHRGPQTRTEELARIRTAAVGDMLGDSKALDEMGPSAVIFRLCRELERLDREADVLSIWLANAYIDIDLLPNIESGAMNPPLPEDVREAAREAVGEGEESCPKN